LKNLLSFNGIKMKKISDSAYGDKVEKIFEKAFDDHSSLLREFFEEESIGQHENKAFLQTEMTVYLSKVLTALCLSTADFDNLKKIKASLIEMIDEMCDNQIDLINEKSKQNKA
jgi:hypothetical protein